MLEKWLSSTCEKSDKKYSEDYIQTTCISSEHDQNTSEASKESVKTVGGVAPTRYPLSIHIVKDNARKMAKFNFKKSNKNNLRINSNLHENLQTMTKTPVKF